MKSYIKKITITSYLAGLFLCSFFLHNTILGSTNNIDKNNQSEKPDVSETNIVGKIDQLTITRQELEKRMVEALRPDPYRFYTEKTTLKDAKSMLLEMLGEKAIALDARKQGLLEDELISQTIKKERQKQVVNLWVQDNIKKNRDKITATEEEIEKQMEVDSKMDRNKAKSTIETAKANKILDQCYANLLKELEVKKVTDNYPKLIEIHDRLLNHPVESRSVSYIRDYQVRDELTEEEKNTALTTFKNGKITIQDWLDFLCDYAPPSRPKNLDTEQGVIQLLEKVIIKPLIMADAHNLGLDKDSSYLKHMQDMENELLFNNIKNIKNQDVNEPEPEEILEFYNNNKEFFIKDRVMKIDQIWCKDLESAKLVKSQLDSGKDFDDIKKEYSLYPESQPYQTSLNNEGYFWKSIWSGNKNEIIGPIKGYHSNGIKWRIVKIIEKEQGNQPEYSKELETTAKYLMMSETAIENIADFCLDTLEKYPYEIYLDKIKDIDPLNIK